ncbi:MAG: L-serine ammonia-lyase, iron-sulfur-dependent, subunit alpha, partial [Bacillota bacterium]|nr:L-serine ammonia-lyase, iron-sulfur-dependent, subunit alpha [Bacillota bacterium]
FTVEHIEEGHAFDIIIVASKDGHTVTVRLADYHTNIVLIEKDGEVLFEKSIEDTANAHVLDRSYLTMQNIFDFANSVDVNDVKDILDKQIECNTAIAQEGIRGNYGSNIGSVLLDTMGNDVRTRAKAMAAAGSDARMNGCEMPVVINSGSGHQGITCCVPVVEYAKELGSSKEQLYRALLISNLSAVHIKTGIGTLSAFCGAVSAGASAGAGIAYLLGGDLETISATLVNTLATVGGIFCDGAKASCASKIATAVDMAITGYNMHKSGNDFVAGDGIVMPTVDETIEGIGRIGKDGMLETNNVIIDLMIKG